MENLKEPEYATWRTRVAMVLKGLRAPKDSGEYKSARMTLEHVLAPSFAAIAVCGIVLLLLVTFVSTQAIPTESEIEVQVVDAETVELEFEEFELPPPEPLDPTEAIDTTIATPDMAQSISLEADVLGMGPEAEAAPLIANAPLITSSPVVLRDLYGNRSPSGRAGALRTYGGSDRTETAVLKALRWLKDNQDPDGSWRRVSTVEHVAMTGLATLTYLAHGVSPDHEEFGLTLRKALEYLLSVQQEDGRFAGGRGYTHGIAAYALTEAYAITRIMDLHEPMIRSIRVIIDGQQSGGGFDYDFRKGTRWDTSVAGWMVQALKAAQMTGTEINGLEEAIRQSVRFMRESAWLSQHNMFRYSGERERGTWTMTAIGILSMQLLGQVRDPTVRLGMASLSDLDMRWNPAESRNPVYGWYYVTQAFFHQGGSIWERWNSRFSEQLIAAQHDDGHWSGAQRGGPVYTTTLVALMLQVYYRYLPTFQAPEEFDFETDVFSGDDVVIEIL